MGVTKHRKKHKEKVNQRKAAVLLAKAQYKKFMMKQIEAIQAQMAAGQSTAVDAGLNPNDTAVITDGIGTPDILGLGDITNSMNKALADAMERGVDVSAEDEMQRGITITNIDGPEVAHTPYEEPQRDPSDTTGEHDSSPLTPIPPSESRHEEVGPSNEIYPGMETDSTPTNE